MAEGILLMPRPAMSAENFNKIYVVGAKFKYYPVAGNKDFVMTETRSECWELGDGHPVVLIKGKSGGVSIFHLVNVDA